jgi:hypothetical protein
MQLNLTGRAFLLGSAALAAVAVATILLPGASAAPSFSIDQPETPPSIQPDVGGADLTLKWHYDWATQGTQVVGAASTATTLQWDPPKCENDGGGTIITGLRSQVVSFGSATPGAPAQKVDGQSIFRIAATQAAPGERPYRCTFAGYVVAPAGQTQIGDSNKANVEVLVTVKYFGLLNAEVPLTVQEGGPQQEIRYDIKLTNLGNAQSYLAFNLIGDVPPGWLAQAPIPTTIQSLQQGATTNQVTVPLIITTPHQNGWNNDAKAFQLKITPSSTKGTGEMGNEIVVPVTARVRGIYVPGPEPILLVGAIVGVAFVARMLRKEE